MRNFRRQSAIIFAALFIFFCAENIASACSIPEEAMPQIRETQKQINFLAILAAGFFVGIIGLYFLNLIINRQWKLTLLFPFSALAFFISCFSYALVFAYTGLCGIDQIYWATLITLVFVLILFSWQLILFIKSIRNRNMKAV